jgi:glycosyltransferase involved in cell wall biosynthesis
VPLNRPRISLIVYNLAKNCFGRAYLLGKMLEPEFEIEVVGFSTGPTWAPCADHGWKESSLPWPRPQDYRKSVSMLAGQVTGDLILACKAWPSVLDIGDEAFRQRHIPRILDIDDWEFGWSFPLRPRKVLSLLVKNWHDPNNIFHLWRAEARTRQWSERIASSRFLQRRFGGTLIPHACDTSVLDPMQLPDRSQARHQFGLNPNAIWVGFVGSPKPHKGLDVLANAVASLDRKDIHVLVAGADDGDNTIDSLRPTLKDQLTVLPPFPKSDLGTILKALDIVALPQRNIPVCNAQMPAKVYDAMAMCIPVVASNISDLPEVLEGCGTVVPPDNSAALAAAIEELANNPEQRKKMGDIGRKRCIEQYSFATVGNQLRNIVWNALDKNKIRNS